MNNKEEILKVTLSLLSKLKMKPIKICNGFNKFSVYAYGEEILLYKKDGYFLKMERKNKINEILNSECYAPYIKKGGTDEKLLILDVTLCENIVLYKRLLTVVIKEAEIKNAKKIADRKNLPLCFSTIQISKEMITMLEKINIQTLNEFRALGPLAIVSILISNKFNPTFSMLLKLESIDRQIPIFLLDERTILRLKTFWKKLDELQDQ